MAKKTPAGTPPPGGAAPTATPPPAPKKAANPNQQVFTCEPLFEIAPGVYRGHLNLNKPDGEAVPGHVVLSSKVTFFIGTLAEYKSGHMAEIEPGSEQVIPIDERGAIVIIQVKEPGNHKIDVNIERWGKADADIPVSGPPPGPIVPDENNPTIDELIFNGCSTSVQVMMRRMPIATLIMFVFLTALSGYWSIAAGIVLFFLLVFVVIRLTKAELAAMIINWPIWAYMGTNNRLYFIWLLGFTLIATWLWLATPTHPPALLETIQSARTDAPASTAPEEQDPVERTRERWRNFKAGKGHVTNEQVRTAESRYHETHWGTWDTRFICCGILWLILFTYWPFVFSDEAKSAYLTVAKRWAAKSGVVSKPLYYDALGAMLKVTPPVLATTLTTGAGTGTITQAGNFAWEFVKELLVEKAIGRGRRR